MVNGSRYMLHCVGAVIFWFLFFCRGVFPTGLYDLFLLSAVFLLLFGSWSGNFLKEISVILAVLTGFLLLGFISLVMQDVPDLQVASKTMYLYIVPVVSALFLSFSSRDFVEVWVRILGRFLLFQCLMFFVVYLINASGMSFLDFVVYRRSGFLRLQGFMGSPNYFAISLFSSYLVYSLLRKKLSIESNACLEIFVRVGVFLAFSRAAIIAFVFYDVLRIAFFSQLSVIAKGFIGFCVFVLAVFLCANFFFKDATEKIYEKLSITVEYRVQDLVTSGSGRFDIWDEAGEYLGYAKYALIGVGPGQYFGMQGVDNQTHNSYMKLIVEHGVIGFFLYMSWLAFLMYGLITKKMRFEQAAFLSILVFSIGNDVFLTKGFSLFIAAIVFVLVNAGAADEFRSRFAKKI